MGQLLEVLQQVADVARIPDQDQHTGTLGTLSGAVGRSGAELQETSHDDLETFWARAAEQGLSLQSVTGFVVLIGLHPAFIGYACKACLDKIMRLLTTAKLVMPEMVIYQMHGMHSSSRVVVAAHKCHVLMLALQ